MSRSFFIWQMIIGWLTFVLVAVSTVMIFFYAPTEKYMGDVQRLFYYHVAAAWNAYLAFALVLVLSILYLWRRSDHFDRWAVAAAELGVLFTTLVLMTGPLWARPVWNAWWRWDDPRLVSTLILWFIYAGYLFLHASIEGGRGKRIAAVFGMIGFIDVPIVHFSVQWWNTLHPAVVTAQGINVTADMGATLGVTTIAFTSLFVYLLMLRGYLEESKGEVFALREQIDG